MLRRENFEFTSRGWGPGDGIGLAGRNELAQLRVPDGVSAGWLSSVGRCIGGGQSRKGGEAGCKSELHLERSAGLDVALGLINVDGKSGDKSKYYE